MSNKTSDKNVANIEKDIKIVKEFIDYAQEVIDDMEYERPVDVTVYQKYLTSMQNILAEREQMLKAINTVEKEKGEWIKAYQEEKDSQFDLLKRIQELEEKVNNSISIQNVIEAISVHQDYLLNQATTSNPTLDANFRNREKYAIQVLQEVLEGGK